LEDKIIGRTTSGNYSFCFNKNLSFGYVNSGNTIETLRKKNLFIEVEKIKYPADILLKPLNTKDYKNS
jgi:4-methylaminobutanoate oxidase (formaldehyde-forming)